MKSKEFVRLFADDIKRELLRYNSTLQNTQDNWGIVTCGEATLPATFSTTATPRTTIDVSAWGFKSVDDYNVFVVGNRKNGANTQALNVYITNKTTTSFMIEGYKGSTTNAEPVDYVIIGKGFGAGNGSGTGTSLPTGGTTGQVLTKASDTDGDAVWTGIDVLPAGGIAEQTILKNSDADGDINWVMDYGTYLSKKEYPYDRSSIGASFVDLKGRYYTSSSGGVSAFGDSGHNEAGTFAVYKYTDLGFNTFAQFKAAYEAGHFNISIDPVSRAYHPFQYTFSRGVYNGNLEAYRMNWSDVRIDNPPGTSSTSYDTWYFNIYNVKDTKPDNIQQSDWDANYVGHFALRRACWHGGVWISTFSEPPTMTFIPVGAYTFPNQTVIQQNYVHNFTGMVLEDLRISGQAIPTDWGIAKTGTLRFDFANNSTTSVALTIDISELGLTSANDYTVQFSIAGGGTMDWGAGQVFSYSKTTTQIGVSYRNTTSSTKDYALVDYVVIAKGFGNVTMSNSTPNINSVLAQGYETGRQIEFVDSNSVNPERTAIRNTGLSLSGSSSNGLRQVQFSQSGISAIDNLVGTITDIFSVDFDNEQVALSDNMKNAFLAALGLDGLTKMNITMVDSNNVSHTYEVFGREVSTP